VTASRVNGIRTVAVVAHTGRRGRPECCLASLASSLPRS
jgi:hypothetical protein